MERLDITVSLPEDLVKQAQSAGLLTDEQIERWLIEELDRQRKLGGFFGKLDQLAALEPPLSEEEISGEIDAYRREKRERKQNNTP